MGVAGWQHKGYFVVGLEKCILVYKLSHNMTFSSFRNFMLKIVKRRLNINKSFGN